MRTGLERVLRDLGAPSTSTTATLAQEWPRLVGADLAQVCTPVTVVDGRLLVSVADPAVVDHLRWLRADLLSTLATHLGEGVVTDVDLRVRRR